MRIISDFHDYYDCMQSYGQDPALIYHRRTQVIERQRRRTYRTPSGFSATPSTIGFCGNLYVVLRLSKWTPKTKSTALCYTLGEADEFIKDHFKKRAVEEYFESYESPKKRRSWWKVLRTEVGYSREDFRRWLAGERKVPSIYDPLEDHKAQAKNFMEHRVPIFWSKREELVLNPCLQDLEFYRVKDAFTAYQEIMMYLGNELAPPAKEMPKHDDKLMRDIKGFDERSFKKEPRR